jgi:predicted metal-binding protein
MTNTSDHSILICATCKGPGAARELRAALAERVSNRFALRAVDCMASCERPIAVGLQGPGKTQYLFGEIEAQADIEAIACFARQFLASDTGWSTASERPERLYDKTLARLPAYRPEVKT